MYQETWLTFTRERCLNVRGCTPTATNIQEGGLRAAARGPRQHDAIKHVKMALIGQRETCGWWDTSGSRKSFWIATHALACSVDASRIGHKGRALSALQSQDKLHSVAWGPMVDLLSKHMHCVLHILHWHNALCVSHIALAYYNVVQRL